MKKAVSTGEAPRPIGPYSQAVAARGFLFISGQIPLDPRTGELTGGNVDGQTEQVMRNIGAVLASAGIDFGSIIKTTIYLKNIGDFPAVNEVYGRYLSQPYPARATVEVSRLPKDVLVEIEAVAVCE